jgi:hypothetical protein
VWAPPRAKPKALYLSLNPSLLRSQRLRQAGLTLASIGGVSLLAGGIVYAKALAINGDIRGGCQEIGGGAPVCNGHFDPSIEDARDRMGAGAITLLTVGGTLAATGVVLFGVGQWQIRRWHHDHPNDPLPPLSGY